MNIEIVLVNENNQVVHKELRPYEELGKVSIIIWNEQYYVFRLVRNHFKTAVFTQCAAPAKL